MRKVSPNGHRSHSPVPITPPILEDRKGKPYLSHLPDERLPDHGNMPVLQLPDELTLASDRVNWALEGLCVGDILGVVVDFLVACHVGMNRQEGGQEARIKSVKLLLVAIHQGQ